MNAGDLGQREVETAPFKGSLVPDTGGIQELLPLQHVPRSFVDYCEEVSETGSVRRGIPQPVGVHELEGGVNFALIERNATRVQLELFARGEDLEPRRVIELDPVHNRTGDIWHVWIKDVPPGQLYDYRIESPGDAATGASSAFKRLLDPCATAIDRPVSQQVMPKCVFTRQRFDWGDDAPPRHAWDQTIIYETHVRGLTAHSSAQVQFPGTFRALIEKIPYLKDLGVTAVELLPVQEFDSTQCRAHDPVTGEPLHNYWGYGPIALLAPHGAYSSSGNSGEQVAEFREMVRALHAARIEVIVDIVFPRQIGPIRPPARRSIIGALRYWVAEMHVDGFRLDLAALLGRDAAGKPLTNTSLLEEIAEDPVLGDIKLIAAAWDTAGAYRVGSFPERRWAEWNRLYRDDVRRFWRGDDGMLGAFASRICGSQDLYGGSGKGPECSVNFVTCHDGFTLNDLVSFRCKHNLSNGEGNCDGREVEYSSNYGVEGPSTDLCVETVRNRQIKNFLLTLFISRGVPMLLGGDEFRRTQQGNNNAYCQDNQTSWYDWRYLQQYADIHVFVRRMISLRREHSALSCEKFYTPADIRWFSTELVTPDWRDPRAKTLGCLIRDGSCGALYLMFNAEEKPMSFHIPPPPARRQWRLAVDTATDLPVSGAGPLVQGCAKYTVEPRSSVVLETTPEELGTAESQKGVSVSAGGTSLFFDACAQGMRGGDPNVAYAAAMLWYQGYPEAPQSGD